MSELLPMRPYQADAVKAIQAAWARGIRRPAVVLPTGAGKTVVFAHLIRLWLEAVWPRLGRRVLIICHRTELIEQAAQKLRDVAPHLSIGIVMADRNETRCDVVVASVQTLANVDRRRMIADVGLIVVDECHHAPAPTWLATLAHYGAWGDSFEPNDRQRERAIAVGFTATMLRSDEKALGDVWEQVVSSRSIGEMVRAGFLVRPRGIRVTVEDLDLRNVKTSRGDYSTGDLGRAITESQAPEAVVKAIREHCPDQPGIVFTPTVETARIMNDRLIGDGQRSAMMWGDMPRDERRRILDDFKSERLDWLVNPQLLTEGTDLPRAAVAVIARPTKSPGLFIQMAGRVLRPYPGKTEAILLDLAGATAAHSLQATMSLFGEEAAALAREMQERDDEQPINDDEQTDLAAALDLDRDLLWHPEGVGQLISREVDLFAASALAWNRTRGGIWFLRAGEDRLIAIIPGMAPGTYDVTSMHAKTYPTFDQTGRRTSGTGRWITWGVNELSYAMAWAEADVTPAEKAAATRERRWRKQEPTQPQRNLARRLGNIVPDGATRGEVSEMIDASLASQRIDPFVPAYARGR